MHRHVHGLASVLPLFIAEIIVNRNHMHYLSKSIYQRRKNSNKYRLRDGDDWEVLGTTKMVIFVLYV